MHSGGVLTVCCLQHIVLKAVEEVFSSRDLCVERYLFVSKSVCICACEREEIM